jgi:hypothetical protein
MIEKFTNMLKNKIFVTVLCVLNFFLFIMGFVLEDFEIMILALLSFAAVLVGMEANKYDDKEK